MYKHSLFFNLISLQKVAKTSQLAVNYFWLCVIIYLFFFFVFLHKLLDLCLKSFQE